ncbi:MAG TPA: serine protease [Streptosporangiaceae bacterium]|jgi:hypothetical protein
MPEPRIGRLLSDAEREARMADETAPVSGRELLRSAFAISGTHVVTAWHCVRDPLATQTPLWFRLRLGSLDGRRYVYLPVRVTNYDPAFDVAVLAIDPLRLASAGLTAPEATAILAAAAIALHPDILVNDTVQVMGFPVTGVGADSDTNQATVVGVALPLGEVTGVKLTGTAFGAVSPVDPHGISGGPVLRITGSAAGRHAAVAVVRAIPRGRIPDAAAGASLVATRLTDVARTLPEVAQAIAASQSPGPQPHLIPASQHSALAVFQACAQALRETVVSFDDPDLGLLTGWPHFFEEAQVRQRPTAVGTAYGLKLALLLCEQDGRLAEPMLAETLWKLRRAGGGWATRTGSGIGRPEIAALVLGALSSAGFAPDRLAEAVTGLEEQLTADQDPVGIARTYVVTAVMRGLLRARPQSRILAGLRTALLDGAIQDREHGDLLCWSSRLSSEAGRPRAPSVPHTAMAVVTLARADRVLGASTASQHALDQGQRWLVSRRDLTRGTEQFRRQAQGDRQELTNVGHFTPAWVARALLATSPTAPEAMALLDAAVHEVWRTFTGGFWEWEAGDRPLWMAYQSASVIRDYAMRLWTPA